MEKIMSKYLVVKKIISTFAKQNSSCFPGYLNREVELTLEY